MRTIEYHQYTLKSSHVPEIINNQIKNGLLYGGIKLTYTKRKIVYKEITIGGSKWLFRIKKFKGKEVTFLRPFKKFWNVKENKLTPNDWGKIKNPYTKIWCELTNGNYNNIFLAITINTLVSKVLHRTVDKELINNLNLQSKRFKVLITNN